MCPASLRHGTITLVLGWGERASGNVCGAGRATMPYMSESRSSPGKCPTNRLRKSERRGTWPGQMIWQSSRSTS